MLFSLALLLKLQRSKVPSRDSSVCSKQMNDDLDFIYHTCSAPVACSSRVSSLFVHFHNFVAVTIITTSLPESQLDIHAASKRTILFGGFSLLLKSENTGPDYF